MDPVRAFPPTRHSALQALRSPDAKERARALQTLSAVYWRPVYGYLRLRWRKPHEEAADLAQEFFAELLEKDLLQRFDPSRARLRTWLRVCIDGVVANQEKAAARQKRGGGAPLIRADVEGAREQIDALAGSAESPEASFEKQWAQGVFAMALERLREECSRTGKGDHFALLEQYDLADARPTYSELARRFGMSLTDVTNRLFRIRRELRRTALDVLRELTVSEEEFREEARALIGENSA